MDFVFSKDIAKSCNLRGWFDVLGIHFFQCVHVCQNGGKLFCIFFHFLVTDLETGELGDVADVVWDKRHGKSIAVQCVLMKLLRLRGRKACGYVLRKGKVWKGSTMVIRWLSASPRTVSGREAGLYVGTVASTKLHKSAVKRNRMRRRCREALRKIVREQEKFPTCQLLICPRSTSLHAPFVEIENDIRAFLSTLH